MNNMVGNEGQIIKSNTGAFYIRFMIYKYNKHGRHEVARHRPIYEQRAVADSDIGRRVYYQTGNEWLANGRMFYTIPPIA